ncbi:MAG: transporter associated domain-containing protein [Alphaproteobacteria bacterium]|nr:transporter associated domain-containing protein [Alphaproteobacteria bacterium]
MASGLSLPSGRHHSLGGFLIGLAKAIPPEGSVMQFEGISFTVEAATDQAVQEVRVKR